MRPPKYAAVRVEDSLWVISAAQSAQSGLDLASLQGQVSANNVANGLTNGFVPSRVDPQTQSAGGVTGSIQVLPNAPVEANINGTLVAFSGTDLIAETVNTQSALAAYQANLATLRAQDADSRVLMSIRS